MVLKMSVKNPLILTALNDILKDPAGKLNPLVIQKSLRIEAWKTSGRTYLQKEYQKGSPTLSQKNRRTSLIKHYKSAWKKWCGWCSEREISANRSNINYVIDFFAQLFEMRLEYRIIDSHRSAISFNDPIENIRIGNH